MTQCRSSWGKDAAGKNVVQLLLDYPAISIWEEQGSSSPPDEIATGVIECDAATLAAIQADPKYAASVQVVEP